MQNASKLAEFEAQKPKFPLLSIPLPSGGSKNFERGRKTINEPLPYLSQIHTTIYMPFTRKNTVFFGKKLWAIRGAAASTAPFESATAPTHWGGGHFFPEFYRREAPYRRRCRPTSAPLASACLLSFWAMSPPLIEWVLTINLSLRRTVAFIMLTSTCVSE